METQIKQTGYEGIRNAAKKYAGLALLAGTLAFPSYAGQPKCEEELYSCNPKTISIQNTDAKGVDSYLALIVDMNGTNYLVSSQIGADLEYIGDFREISTIKSTARKSAEIDALVRAEITKGTNGLVKLTGEINDKERMIYPQTIIVDEKIFHVNGTYWLKK